MSRDRAAARRSSISRARALAVEVHGGQVDRHGEPMIDHVQRVAAAVPEPARAVALVHDVCERSELSPQAVARRADLSDDEQAALALLTKHEGESLLDHTARVVGAPAGTARAIALAVKRADLDDHAPRSTDQDPPYPRALALLAGDGSILDE